MITHDLRGVIGSERKVQCGAYSDNSSSLMGLREKTCDIICFPSFHSLHMCLSIKAHLDWFSRAFDGYGSPLVHIEWRKTALVPHKTWSEGIHADKERRIFICASLPTSVFASDGSKVREECDTNTSLDVLIVHVTLVYAMQSKIKINLVCYSCAPTNHSVLMSMESLDIFQVVQSISWNKWRPSSSL